MSEYIVLILIFVAILFILLVCCHPSPNNEQIHEEYKDNLSHVYVNRRDSEKRRTEKRIFEKSFELIGECYPGDLKNKYLKAYNQTLDGKIDWHNVFPYLSNKGINDNAYTLAIQETSDLIPFNDSYAKREIYSLVEKLIKIRKQELMKFENRKDDNYRRHQYVIECWTHFKNQIKPTSY